MRNVMSKTRTILNKGRFGREKVIIPNNTHGLLHDLVNEYQEYPDDPLMSFTDGAEDKAFSICAEVSFSLSSNAQSIIAKRLNEVTIPSGGEWSLAVLNTEKAVLTLIDENHKGGGVDSRFLSATCNTILTGGVKNNIIFTYDGSATLAGIKAYMNGIISTVTDSSMGTYNRMPTDNAGSTSPVLLGKFSFSTAVKFHGFIYNISIFHEVLDANQVLRLNNGANPADVGNCVWYNKQTDKGTWDGTNWSSRDWSRNSNKLTVSSLMEESDRRP